MSIYIKGIDVPKEGTVIVIDSTGQVWSNEWPTRGYTRIDGAKAVSVPEHGRGMSKCDVCINKKYCVNHLDARTMCPQMDYVLFTPSYKTNYDCLISKTPEEMAEYLSSICYELWKMFSDDPKKTWLDWLKSQVEVDDGATMGGE